MSTIKPFRFWCQKVLPLVYDESMSYYELLNKVVLYLNNVISDFDTVAENFDNLDAAFDSLQAEFNTSKNQLLEAYELLQTYVNNYFDNLDVQEEINNKLDDMAESGELEALVAPYIATRVSADVAAWLAANITPTSPAVDASLTVSGAAADALATGIRFTEVTSKTGNLFTPNFIEQTISGTASMKYTGTAIEFSGTTGPGSTGTGGSRIISQPVYLAAGNYRFGFMSPVSSSKMNIKLRVYDNGSAGTDISGGGTSSAMNVTVSDAGLYCIQLRYFGTQDFSGINGQIFLVQGSANPEDYMPPLTAQDLEARKLILQYGENLPTGTDLETLLSPGIYRGAAGSDLSPITYQNGPLVDGVFVATGGNMSGYNFILTVIKQRKSKVTVQKLEVMNMGDNTPYKLYYRVATGTGPSWQNWRKAYDKSDLDAAANHYYETLLTDKISLNDAPLGYTRGGSTRHYRNCPPELLNDNFDVTVTDPTTQETTTTNYEGFTGYDFLLLTLGQMSSTVKMQFMYLCNMGAGTPYAVFYRIATGSGPTWNEWRNCLTDNLDNTNTTTFVPDESTANTGYTGAPLRIMTYNVEHWDHDKSTAITNARVKQVRAFLADKQPNFVCVQESGYIDKEPNQVRTATNYVFRPLYPKDYGRGEVRIHSRMTSDPTEEAAGDFPATWCNGCVQLTYTRRLSYLRVTYNGRKVLICSVHCIAAPDYETPGADPASVAARLEQYETIFSWLSREITLNRVVDSGAPAEVAYAPSWDCCIIGGDFNTITADDKTNLATYANTAGFQLTNGTYLGWLESQHNKNGVKALDNICYAGCYLNGMHMYKGAAQRFYSDHYPFICDFTIPDATT